MLVPGQPALFKTFTTPVPLLARLETSTDLVLWAVNSVGTTAL